MKRTNYKEFIGDTITLTFKDPMAIMGVGYSWNLLHKELYRRIKKELGWTNGLLCDFSNVSSKIVDNKIVITGTVIKCEVDC